VRGRVSVGSVLVATAALAVGAAAIPAAAQGGLRAPARTPSAPTWTMPPAPAPEPSPPSHQAAESSFVTQRPVAGGQVTADLGVVPTSHAGPGGQGLPDDGLATVTGVAGYPLEAPGALRPVRFGDSADRLVQLGLARGPVTLSSKDLRVGAPRQQGRQASHAGAATDTDLAYRVEPIGVKEALVLRSPKSPTSYRFHLADPTGQLGSARTLPGGGVTFTGRQGDLALSMPPAVAYEQAGADPFAAPAPSQTTEPAAAPAPGPRTSAPTGAGPAPAVPLLPGSDSAMLHVVAAGDGFDVRVAVRPDWLRGRRFPVVLDPSLVFGNADGTVFDATTVVNGNYALVAHTDDRVGPQVEYNYIWRSYLRFNTSAIPAGATVTSARFHWVRQWGGSYSPRPLELHAINGDWNMNSSSYTMNSLTDTTAAATGTPDTQDFDVTALARDWVSGTRGNYGISAQLNPEVMNDAYAYGFYGYYASRSTSAPSPDVTPHLFVTYNQTTPLPVDVTSLTPHNAAMTATWSTSKDNGPNGPDGYYVDVFDSGGNYVGYANGQPVTGNSVTFGSAYNPYTNSWTNFPNGYALSVRVNPHNAAGFGGWGAARSATVQGAPSAVYGPDGNPATPPSVVVGDGTVSATWTTGNLHGGTLQGYVAFLYPAGQHWPAAPTAACSNLSSPTVTFGPSAPSGDCSGSTPVNGTSYSVEVFQQNYSGDNYSGPLTDNTGTGPGFGPPVTTDAAVATRPCQELSSPAVTAVGSGGTSYSWDINGTMVTQVAPPVGFSPTAATDAELLMYQFPTRPHDAEALAGWTAMMSGWHERVIGLCVRPDVSAVPGPTQQYNPSPADDSPTPNPLGGTSAGTKTTGNYAGLDMIQSPDVEYTAVHGQFNQTAYRDCPSGTPPSSHSTWVGIGGGATLIQTGTALGRESKSTDMVRPFFEAISQDPKKSVPFTSAPRGKMTINGGDPIDASVDYNYPGQGSVTSSIDTGVTDMTGTS